MNVWLWKFALLRRKYFESISDLRERKEHADTELKEYYEFRQALIEKNLSRVYSNEIFKEQNRMVKKKTKAAMVAKDDDLIEKYNLEEMAKFVANKLGNLVQTYIDFDL